MRYIYHSPDSEGACLDIIFYIMKHKNIFLVERQPCIEPVPGTKSESEPEPGTRTGTGNQVWIRTGTGNQVWIRTGTTGT